MPARFLDPLRGALSSLAVGLNTLLMTLAMVPPALLKLLVPVAAVRVPADRALNALAATWVACNNAWIAAVRPAARWQVQGVQDLDPRRWYLVTSNHQSWVDILVLQRIFHGHAPFLKFFLKRELIWVPVIGLAWWALDFPFMRRGSSRGARGNDLEATRRACEKFKRLPTSVMNFLEGTRFTAEKHAEQKSPYRHLLKPKVGGLGIALATMGGQFDSLLDVTIVYPQGRPTFADLLCGRVEQVIVHVQPRQIPADLAGAPAGAERAQHRRLTRWVEQQWLDKDELIERLLHPAGRPPAP
ncbi:MAG: acyltransferase [Rubrivivax sp.]|nr:acyltransferase [Rubrivivax sp.]